MDVQQLRKQAKDLIRAARQGEPAAEVGEVPATDSRAAAADRPVGGLC